MTRRLNSLELRRVREKFAAWRANKRPRAICEGCRATVPADELKDCRCQRCRWRARSTGARRENSSTA